MDLPKIRNENLPEELKDLLGENDAEFDAVVDPMDIVDIQYGLDSYHVERQKISQMLIDSRKRQAELHEMLREVRKKEEVQKQKIETQQQNLEEQVKQQLDKSEQL